MYSLTIKLHHVKVSAKSNETRINYDFFCHLALLLESTKAAAVARSNGKTRALRPLTFRMPQHTSSEVTVGYNTIRFKC